MVRPISRLLLAALVAATTLTAPAEEQKCNGSARECDQQIRQFLSGRRFLGATIEDKNPGLVIQSVTPNGPAERAGLIAGDRLIVCNSRSLTQATARDFKQLLADARENGRLRLIVWRRGAYKKIEARLEPYSKEQIDKIVSAHLAQSHPASAGAQHR
jgi:predicted metalloprotease with PDZ domain